MGDINRREAVKRTAVAGATAVGVLAVGTGTARAAENETIKIVPIAADKKSVNVNHMHFFVVTGSDTPPIVCMAGNDGFPPVLSIGAVGGTHMGKKGVGVMIVFSKEVGNVGADKRVGLNLLQAGMMGDYTVIPRV